MPLRSVEAATRDDAIAAAREQFGPQARVVGVRRVRSGGVLGFFATERYVAEVAPDRPPGPVPPTSRDDDLGASPLASASPATAAPAGRARTGAPARNGAAAYADVARPAEPLRPATRAAFRSLTWTPDEPVVDDVRVSELAGLLGGVEPRSSPSARAHPRTTGPQRATFPKAPWTTPLHDEDAPGPHVERPASSAPSPFTAALARMVAGDSHVRQAVEAAVGESKDESPAAAPRSDEERRPARSTPARSADTAVWPRAARQEEETVGDQVIAPPSMPEVQPVEVPPWVAEPEVVTVPDSSREEAIAEVLRSALAQGHSDEALTGILREVLDGVSPQAALVEPASAAPELVMPGDVVAVEPVAVAEPVALPEPVTEASVEPAPVFEPVARPYTPLPAFQPFTTRAPLPAVDIWGTPTLPPLWGEAASGPPDAGTDAPIWAEIVLGEPAPSTTPGGPVSETAGEPVVACAELTEDTEDTEDTVGEVAPVELEVEVEVEEVAPLLARTASDPAPLPMTMSLDATSVMPPLSLLPPLPSSRGRGRPPVPPASRPPAPPSRPSAEAAPTPDVEAAPVAPPLTGPATTSLATVTRLPVTPLMAGLEIPGPTEPEIELSADAGIDVDEHAIDEAAAAPAASPPAEPVAIDLPAQPAVVVTPKPETAPVPGDVVGRLAALGVPARLLGTDFAGDVERFGLYAAITRALGLRLPAPPELPTGAGEVLFVVGPGVETLRAARRLAASLCLDPDRVQWATSGDLSGLAPATNRVTTIDGAMARRLDATQAGTVTIVAVDAPLRADAYWMRQMLAIWSPVAVWAVVEATRKPEDVEPWLAGMARVDALIVQDTDLSADPAAVLHRVSAPVAVLDGVRATPHRWASLLCERLDGSEA